MQAIDQFLSFDIVCFKVWISGLSASRGIVL